MRYLGLLLLASLAAAAAPAQPSVRQVRRAEELASAFAGDAVLWCHLRAGELSAEQQQELRDWVADGGTLWTETDLSALFGFGVIEVQPRERIGRAKRGTPIGSAAFCAQVEEVFYRFGRAGVMLTGHPSAVALLVQVDPPVARRDKAIVAAELWYGRGRVVHRPAEIHESRLQGKQFQANLTTFSPQRDDAVPAPVDQLALAEQLGWALIPDLDDEPDQARRELWRIVLACRLWYAEYLTAIGQYGEALAHLRIVATELPDEPAVYLAVSRLNRKLNRVLPADEAYQKAVEGYQALGLEVPGPDARRVRVPWPTFVATLNAAQAAYDQPSEEKASEVAARLSFLRGLDSWRAGNLEATTQLWTKSAKALPRWALPPYHLGLVQFGLGLEPAQANRARAQQFEAASSLFLRASLLPESAEFPAAAVEAAKAWSEASTKRLVALTNEPPDAEFLRHFIFRYDAGDRRFQAGPTMQQMSAALERAYEAVASLGIWLDPVEVQVYPDRSTMLDHLPAVGATPQVAEMVASAGSRLYCYPAINELSQFSRHELTRIMSHRLTEEGLAPPLWILEGLATGMEQDPRKAQAAKVQMQRGNAMTIAQLNDPNLAYGRQTTDHAFGQSQVMAEALAARFGLDSVVPYLQLVGWGTAPEAAFQQWTGMTQEAFLNALLQNRLGG